MLDILDTAGQEDYIALRSTWSARSIHRFCAQKLLRWSRMRQRDGFLLVYSVTDRATFDVSSHARATTDQLTCASRNIALHCTGAGIVLRAAVGDARGESATTDHRRQQSGLGRGSRDLGRRRQKARRVLESVIH